MKHLLIAISTGRKHFEKTIKMINENILLFKSNEKVKISLLINYDISFKNIPAKDFIINKDEYIFNNFNYFGENQLKEYLEEFKSYGLTDIEIKLINQNKGYGNKKNLLILYAIKNQYDYILYYDDEYPITCMKDQYNNIIWEKTDLIGGYLKGIKKGADITFGFWNGYVSPIPTNIITKIPNKLSYNIGTALEIGTDVITHNKFSEINNIFFIPEKIPKIEEIEEIEEIQGSKLISGGNLCFKLKSVIEGKIPSFYFPEKARGEDSIMSMRLSNAKVFLVPCGIFHDSFQKFLDIPNGNYPKTFDYNNGINNTEEYKRFYNVFVGWLTYTPLLIRLRYGKNYKNQLKEM